MVSEWYFNGGFCMVNGVSMVVYDGEWCFNGGVCMVNGVFNGGIVW